MQRNVLMEQGRVTGVIDWSLALVADPAFDVGSTNVVLAYAPSELPAAAVVGLFQRAVVTRPARRSQPPPGRAVQEAVVPTCRPRVLNRDRAAQRADVGAPVSGTDPAAGVPTGPSRWTRRRACGSGPPRPFAGPCCVRSRRCPCRAGVGDESRSRRSCSAKTRASGPPACTSPRMAPAWPRPRSRRSWRCHATSQRSGFSWWRRSRRSRSSRTCCCSTRSAQQQTQPRGASKRSRCRWSAMSTEGPHDRRDGPARTRSRGRRRRRPGARCYRTRRVLSVELQGRENHA